MVRWLILLAVLGLAAPADAQVFKPKGRKTESTEKKPAKKAKKTSKKKVTAKRKSAAPARDRSGGRKVDPDYVKITDDEEIE